jgi:hypothetical protein
MELHNSRLFTSRRTVASLLIIATMAFMLLLPTIATAFAQSADIKSNATTSDDSATVEGKFELTLKEKGNNGDNNSEEDKSGEQSFDAEGAINVVSYITESQRFNLQGTWNLEVKHGSVVKFDSKIDSEPIAGKGKTHTHQLKNYNPLHTGTLDSDKNFFTRGTIDIGTNGKITWKDVPVSIIIRNGDTISISLDDSLSDHHFAGQPILGTVESIEACSPTPGPDMSFSEDC